MNEVSRIVELKTLFLSQYYKEVQMVASYYDPQIPIGRIALRIARSLHRSNKGVTTHTMEIYAAPMYKFFEWISENECKVAKYKTYYEFEADIVEGAGVCPFTVRTLVERQKGLMLPKAIMTFNRNAHSDASIRTPRIEYADTFEVSSKTLKLFIRRGRTLHDLLFQLPTKAGRPVTESITISPTSKKITVHRKNEIYTVYFYRNRMQLFRETK